MKFYLFIKRTFDIFVSLIGIVLLIPITIIIKICYLITGDFKSIFYYQKRIGKNGKVFKMFKYRSMVPNAEEKLKELLKDPAFKKEWDENQKFENDPRITRIGRIIRKLSIDEMPQFVNILLNDISLIGPRPLVPGELEKFGGNPKIYNSIKPGLTGWWAVNGRSATTYKQRLNLEYYYVKNRSLKLDILCILKTFKVVIKKTGAR